MNKTQKLSKERKKQSLLCECSPSKCFTTEHISLRAGNSGTPRHMYRQMCLASVGIIKEGENTLGTV